MYRKSEQGIFSTVVFKAKVLQAWEERRQSEQLALESDGDSSSAEESTETATLENTVPPHAGEVFAPSASTTSIFTQHEIFIKKQAAIAKRYMERKDQLPGVSSRCPVEGSEERPSAQKKPAMEGKGPRVVPSSVKNRRHKLKKKRAKERTLETTPSQLFTWTSGNKMQTAERE